MNSNSVTRYIVLFAFLLLIDERAASASVRYVWQSSPSPGAPYATWATAAQTIQDAVDAAVAGDEIIVTNGVYATGGRAIYGTMTNRVAVTKQILLRSVNGPQVTSINGHQLPGTTNGDSAIRCVYVASGATIAGFTLANGATRGAGDYLNEMSGGGILCESVSAVVSNCIITGNSCSNYGGGACGGTVVNSAISSNSAGSGGGGVYSSAVNSCAIYGNSGFYGGGGGSATLNDCTVTGNLGFVSGGAYSCKLTNCIVYFNRASSGTGPNWDDSSRLAYCCTTPLPLQGVGNFILAPELASASHLSASSPCRGSGSPLFATGTDIDGESWANPPSVGCDEYRAGSVTGPLSVVIAAWTNVATSYAMDIRAVITGRVSASAWDFGDGIVVSNRPYAIHAWSSPGLYPVVLRAWNESNPGGVSATSLVQVVDAIHYVSVSSFSPVAPYSSWATAATNIQDAVDAATVPGALVLVSNGVYATGGRVINGAITNRVVVEKPLVLQSVTGPKFTLIEGYQVPGTTNGNQAVRCVYLADKAILDGFTLTNGATRTAGDYDKEQSGGGAWSESVGAIVTNCIFAGNSSGNAGGGTYSGTINNCLFTANSAVSGGGGAYLGVLNNCLLTGNFGFGPYTAGGGTYGSVANNCTIAGNSARNAGGASAGTLNNCIVYHNSNPDVWAATYTTLNYCCAPDLHAGIGTITNEPLFVDLAGRDFRLQSASPCINSGQNNFVTGPSDFEGGPRIANGAVDIGCYEFQGTGSLISYAWLLQYGLPLDGSVDYADNDGDGLNNWQEWRCQTVPTNSLSVLRLLGVSRTATNVNVSWQSVAGVNYLVERSTDLTAFPAFLPLARNIPGQNAITVFTDAAPPGGQSCYYRVGVGQ